jgi:hypothetical protein
MSSWQLKIADVTTQLDQLWLVVVRCISHRIIGQMRIAGRLLSQPDNFGAIRHRSVAHRRRNGASDALRRAAKRVRVQMGIARRRCGIGMPQKLADDRKAHAAARAETGEGVADIVNTKAF